MGRGLAPKLLQGQAPETHAVSLACWQGPESRGSEDLLCSFQKEGLQRVTASPQDWASLSVKWE